MAEQWHLAKATSSATDPQSVCGGLGYVTTSREQATCERCLAPQLDDEEALVADAIADRIAARLGGRVMSAVLPAEVCAELEKWKPEGSAFLYMGANQLQLRFSVWGGGQLRGEMYGPMGNLIWSGTWGRAGG